MKTIKRSIPVFFALIFVLTLTSYSALAADISVSTFAELQAAVNNATGQTNIITSNDITLTGAIIVTNGKNITIKSSGNNLFTLAIAGNYRHLIVNTGANLTLENIILDGGYYGIGNYRGGINNNGNLTLNNGAVIRRCYAEFGGGINNEGIATIKGSALSYNVAFYDGGGIINYGSLDIIDSEISANEAVRFGGGIYNLFGITTVIDNKIFDNRSREDSGGGIYNDIGFLEVIDSEIIGNSGVNFGGGIYNSDTATVIGSEIIGNNANNGGGIFNSDIIEVINSEISSNSAYSFGGGIYNNNSITVIGGKVSNNKSSRSSGGIYTHSLQYLKVNDTAFENNSTDQAYWMISSADIALYNEQIKGVTQFSTPPPGNKPFEYAYNNYDINYTRGLTENPLTQLAFVRFTRLVKVDTTKNPFVYTEIQNDIRGSAPHFTLTVTGNTNISATGLTNRNAVEVKIDGVANQIIYIAPVDNQGVEGYRVRMRETSPGSGIYAPENLVNYSWNSSNLSTPTYKLLIYADNTVIGSLTVTVNSTVSQPCLLSTVATKLVLTLKLIIKTVCTIF